MSCRILVNITVSVKSFLSALGSYFAHRGNARFLRGRSNFSITVRSAAVHALACSPSPFQWRKKGHRVTVAQKRVLHLILSDVQLLPRDPRKRCTQPHSIISFAGLRAINYTSRSTQYCQMNKKKKPKSHSYENQCTYLCFSSLVTTATLVSEIIKPFGWVMFCYDLLCTVYAYHTEIKYMFLFYHTNKALH